MFHGAISRETLQFDQSRVTSPYTSTILRHSSLDTVCIAFVTVVASPYTIAAQN